MIGVTQVTPKSAYTYTRGAMPGVPLDGELLLICRMMSADFSTYTNCYYVQVSAVVVLSLDVCEKHTALYLHRTRSSVQDVHH